MAVGAWYEPSPACRDRWASWHRRSGLDDSCSAPQKDPLLQLRGRGGRAAGPVEELFQWLDALFMNSLPPVLASGLVGTAVRGWLACLSPL